MEHYATGQQVFAGGLVFARLAAIVMLIPGFGETFVPVRIRLSLALTLAFVLFPVVGGSVPPMPADVSGLALAIIRETAIGLMIGTILQDLHVLHWPRPARSSRSRPRSASPRPQTPPRRPPRRRSAPSWG